MAHGISNLKSIIKIEGIADRGDGFFQSIPMVYRQADNAYNTSIIVEGTDINIQTGQDRSMFNGYVILEYTKTTD